jgi:hypothetical protein
VSGLSWSDSQRHCTRDGHLSRAVLVRFRGRGTMEKVLVQRLALVPPPSLAAT